MKDINYNDLCDMIANEVGYGATRESTKRYLKAIYRVILKQLKLKNRIYFKDFGYWEIKQRKSGEREINNPMTNEKRVVYVKPKYSIFFKPSINFDKSVNENDFKIITDKGIKRLPKNKPFTTSDLINKANSRAKRKEE